MKAGQLQIPPCACHSGIDVLRDESALTFAYLDGLIDIADIFCFHVRVLLPTAHQFREGSQKALYPDSAHVHELPGHQGCREHRLECLSMHVHPQISRRTLCQHLVQSGWSHWDVPFPDLVTTDAAKTTILVSCYDFKRGLVELPIPLQKFDV